MTATVDDNPLSGTILGVRHVVQSFGHTVALNDVSVSIGPSESMALLGANGAGKSSLVKILSGAAKPDSGEVIVDGQVTALSGVHEARAHGICFVPQELTVAPDLTVAENVLAGGWPARGGLVRDSAGEDLVTAACRRVGLLNSPRQLVSRLSPSERRLLMIARGLIAEPRILILDEPTAALGASEADRMVEVLTTLRENDLSMVYISHRMAEISRLCDSVTVLRNGEVVMRDAATPESVRRAVHVGMASRSNDEDSTDGAIDIESIPRAPGESAVAIRTRGLSNAVLRDVSVEVGAGEIVGVAGLLGSGRTELLRAIAGADLVQDGSVEVYGKRLAARSPRDAIAAGIALLPEDRRNQGGLLGLSVKENLTMARLPSRWGWLRLRSEHKKAVSAIERFGIRCSGPNALLSTLSGGNQQKVILARWLTAGARVLLLDEPTAGIDVVAKAELMELVRQAVVAGGSAIVVSSELDELSGYCDRIYILRDGELRHEVAGSTSVSNLARLCGEVHAAV